MTGETQDGNKQETRHTVRQDIIDIFAKRLVRTLNEKAEKPIEDLKDNLPSNSEEIRKLPFYKSFLEALRYQRDNYLVGTGHADRQQQHRYQGIPVPPLSQIAYDANALGSTQIINLGAWFIPSTTVKDALLPIVVSLPSTILKDPITEAVANAIPLAQPLLDDAVKNSLLAFMDDPHWRQVIKSRAGGLMSGRKNPPSDPTTPP